MTMRLHVDRSVCAGHGVCYGTAPEILDADEQGDPIVREDPLREGHVSLGQEVVRRCPERALSLSG